MRKCILNFLNTYIYGKDIHNNLYLRILQYLCYGNVCDILYCQILYINACKFKFKSHIMIKWQILPISIKTELELDTIEISEKYVE